MSVQAERGDHEDVFSSSWTSEAMGDKEGDLISATASSHWGTGPPQRGLTHKGAGLFTT